MKEVSTEDTDEYNVVKGHLQTYEGIAQREILPQPGYVKNNQFDLRQDMYSMLFLSCTKYSVIKHIVETHPESDKWSSVKTDECGIETVEITPESLNFQKSKI